ncbi:MAG TPA: AAA family ATPase [Candidatus Brocadiia bacterium]|nr:AAA family ATPase [Candidatus Brocadiia bacterium]
MSDTNEAKPAENDLELIEKLRDARKRMASEMARIIVGQDDVVDQLLVALFCGGHSLMIGVPGLAKTLMVRTIANILDLSFNRIQFTPDLMPSDITGSEIISEDAGAGRRDFRFVSGPVFANIVLADEINRTPPKTQAALLQAMEEHRVTVAGKTYALEEPFFVLATQNPIEQEGTYPLPEAQLDRFMFSINIDYPSIPEEIRIVQATTGGEQPELAQVLDAAQVVTLRKVVRRIPAATSVVEYAVRLASATRPTGLGRNVEWVRKYVRWGAGPRASQYLTLGAKARAVLRGNLCITEDDVKGVARAVLRHRIITNFQAESEGVKPIDIIEHLLQEGPPPAT